MMKIEKQKEACARDCDDPIAYYIELHKVVNQEASVTPATHARTVQATPDQIREALTKVPETEEDS